MMGGRARVVTGAKHGVSHLSYRQNFFFLKLSNTVDS